MANNDRSEGQNGGMPPTGPEGASRRVSGVDLDARRELRSETRRNQTYKAFLNNLMVLGSMNEEEAEKAAVSVLCVLEQRLFGEEAAHLEAQLPGKLRDLLIRCERHIGKPVPKFGRYDFIRMVSEELETDLFRAERHIRAVFAALRDQVSEGEIEDVIGQLPADLRELWRRPV